MTKPAEPLEREEAFENDAELSISFRSWTADSPRAVMVIVPGFNSHSGYYRWVAKQLVAIGFAVYAVDLRGRGRSEGERFYVGSFTEYVRDVAGVATIARSRHAGLPVFVLGHSAGGVVGCAYAIENQASIAGFICESFAFQVPAPDFALAVMKGISHLTPRTHVLRLKNQDFSRDLEVVRRMNNDPLIANESQPTRTVAEMVRADERLKVAFPKLKVPLLILHGTQDHATKPAGSQYFFEHAGSTDKTLKLYEGYFHDPLNDIGKEIVMADVADWLKARI